MAFQYKMPGQGHVRSHSHIIPQSNQKYHNKIPVVTQSTSLGSSASNNRSKSLMTKLTNFLTNKPKNQCNYCVDCKKINFISSKINSKLYSKYSSSQNYYYTRDVNEILTNARTNSVILFKDLMFLDENEEYMKRQYLLKEYPQKIKLLTEYYKFHQDIPRLFMMPTTNTLNNFHDKKRRIEYYRIAQIIEEENKKNPKRPPKGIVGDKPDKLETESSTQERELQVGEKNAVGEILLNDISSFINRGNGNIDDQEARKRQNSSRGHGKKRQIAKQRTQQEEISLTILELNKKLEQIANKSNFLVDQSSMVMKECTQHNLQDFLAYMDQSNMQPKLNQKIKIVTNKQQNKNDAPIPIVLKSNNNSNNSKNPTQNSNHNNVNNNNDNKQNKNLTLKQKIGNLKLDDLDILIKQKQSNTNNTEQQYSARSIQNLINNKSIKQMYENFDKVPQTSKNENNSNIIRFEPQSTKSQKQYVNNFLSPNKELQAQKKSENKKINFQLNLKNLEQIGFTNAQIKTAKAKPQNKDSNLMSPNKETCQTNYSPRLNMKNTNKFEFQDHHNNQKKQSSQNQQNSKKQNKKQQTPQYSKNKKIVLSLEEDNDYQCVQKKVSSPQTAQTHRAFNFSNNIQQTKGTDHPQQKDEFKPKLGQTSVNSSQTSQKTKKIKSPRNSVQNSISSSKHQNMQIYNPETLSMVQQQIQIQQLQPKTPKDIRESIDRNIQQQQAQQMFLQNQQKQGHHQHNPSGNFQFNQQPNTQAIITKTQQQQQTNQKSSHHKHTKSENFQLNMNYILQTQDYESPADSQQQQYNSKQQYISQNQSPNRQQTTVGNQFQKKSGMPTQYGIVENDQQKELISKLSQFNFSHNFLKVSKEGKLNKGGDSGILQSERGTNSTHNKIMSSGSRSLTKQQIQSQQQQSTKQKTPKVQNSGSNQQIKKFQL